MRRAKSEAPIGVFDSGVGGLTVARAIAELLPNEEMRYVADSAHQPYGPQSVAQVRKHALAVLDSLVEEGVKMLVIACNSASVACLADARERYPVPVVEVVLPAVRSALAATRTGRIGVIGTRITIASRAYEDSFAAVAPHTRIVSAPCPQFVDFIERGVVSGPRLEALAREYLAPLEAADVDVLVLGCTHYPLLAELIGEVMGPGVRLVSPSEETAKDVARILAAEGVSRPGAGAPAPVLVTQTGQSDRLFQWAGDLLGGRLLAAGPTGAEDADGAEQDWTRRAAVG
ncbi:glutamate racemase [Segniliparus rugosus]|uniref:Glutamate racemase n=1 Tax=Segniliparus rugosus (strain ATCC BAA-974 / DSM 45345 / CCUG 50838 / CIP 108380 / JCM 13579 / CDC 945) TaxID=679197 RepID=E5XTG8_SEGRC|nr:glutamate racemase [Segniliparus rugosus]EFV12351.1 glutamate racemase [Segniliparus rugosus ATCC BAA-974]